MQIKIGICNDNNIVANKHLTTVITTNILKFHGDILNPSITIPYDERVLNCNYCYIDALGRYYYIVPNVDNHVITLVCNVDALTSFYNDILNANGHITRSSNGSKWIVDNLCVQTNKSNFKWRKLGDNIGEQSARYIVSIGGR